METLTANDAAAASNTAGSPQSLQAGVYLQWQHVDYTVSIKGKKEAVTTRTLLNDVSGRVIPGQMLAIMGASGAGKTTLLNILAHRTGGYSGRVTCNGAALDDSFKRICGYVTQDSPFLEALTPRETLQFNAMLTLPDTMSHNMKMERVEAVIKRLSLSHCADTTIGGPGYVYATGISGGERRRLALAVELISDPQVIICDEVTSGLDSASAHRIVAILRELATEDNRTIVCTIHQPRANILAMFDNVLLLAAGQVVYMGPTWHAGHGDGVVAFFKDAGYPLPAYDNPADAMIDVVNGGMRLDNVDLTLQDVDVQISVVGTPAAVVQVREPSLGPSQQEEPTTAGNEIVIHRLAEYYRQSSLYKAALTVPDDLPPPPKPKYGSVGRYPTSCWRQCSTISRRTFLYKLRLPDATMTQFFGSVFIAIIIGTVFWQLPLTQAGVRDRLSAISFLILTQSFMAFDLVVLAPHERVVMLRDSDSGMYSTSAFFWGRTAAEFPMHTLFALVVGCVTYWMFGLANDIGKFFIYVLLMVLVTQAGASLLLLVGSISKSMAMGNALATIVLVFSSLFNGFFIHPDNTPKAYRWITDISFPAFGVKAAVTNEFSGLSYWCTPVEAQAGCAGSGSAFLETLGFGTVEIWRMCVYLTLEIVIMRLLAFFALHFCYTGQPFRERLRLLFSG